VRLKRTIPILLAAVVAAVPAAAKIDPSHRWRTLETPHFAIHFHEGCEELAARAAPIAEAAHERLAPRIGWTPDGRTQLIIADDADAAGGWATPYFSNQIYITATPPLGEYGLGTTRRDDWLRFVITHEYTHVLQLDMASGIPLWLRRGFGRLYFPNSLQPLWLIEGLATFEETELTPGGRGRSPGSSMFLRMAALEGPFPTLDQMAVLPDAWPGGQVPYLFGESFLRYLAGRFGRQSVARISQAYGGQPLPFLVESTGAGVLGEHYRELWDQWATELRERSRELARTVTARGLSPSAALTADGWFNGSPAWSPDGRRIAWLRADGRGDPGLWTMAADGSNREFLTRNAFSTTSSGSTLAWSGDGRRLFYTRQSIVRGAASINDVWAWDLGREGETRVTSGLRVRDPDPSPDGRSLALVVAARGLTQLALLELDARLPVRTAAALQPLTELTAEQFAEPRWSPDSRRIAVSVWIPGGEQEIRVLDRAGRLLARVGHPHAFNGAPTWGPDGQTLYFTSDASGIFNVYAWNAATAAIFPVTNVIGGAFSPAPSPDGRRLAFANYSARGYDLHVLDLDASAASAQPHADAEDKTAPATPSRPAIRSQAERDREPLTQLTSGDDSANGRVQGGPQRQDPEAWTGTSTPAVAVSSTPYSPLDTLLPRFWLPLLSSSPASGTLVGLATGGEDVLQRHRYALNALYAPGSGRFMHSLEYAYDGLRPTLRLSSSDDDRTYVNLLQDTRGSADYTERRRTVGAEISLGFPGPDCAQAFSLGYRYRELSPLTPAAPWPDYEGAAPVTGALGSARVGWTFSNAHRQPLSISLANGRRVSIQIERYQEGLGSSITSTVAALDWNEYVALPLPGHVLAARLFLGGMTGIPPQQGVFNLGGSHPGALDSSPDDLALLLRGYRPDAYRGERALLASLEYRFPLLEIGRGGISAPFFVRRLHGALFIDTGEAWDSGPARAGRLHTGVGAEIRCDLLFSAYVPLTLRFGVAAGLDGAGGVYPTLGIWMPTALLGVATARQN